MSRPIRRLLVAVTTLLGLLALPGTAFAMTEPVRPDAGAPGPTPVIIQNVTSTVSVAAWQLAAVALTAAVVAAVAVAVLGRVMGAVRRTRPQTA
ncbi:MAG TPA: hypothetical protein VLV82_01875 [Candidatus Angelobacter sp.]|nr:hypothetical protein [Candidatus Angelobacter sp.]